MKSGLFAVVIGLAFLSGTSSAQEIKKTSRSNQMKQFSLLVRVPEDYTTEQSIKVGPQWDRLLEQWKAENVYVLSFAFPGESYTVSGKEKEIKKAVVLSGKLRVVSNIVLQAESLADAVEQAKRCPVLPYDGSVEVREIPKPVQPIK